MELDLSEAKATAEAVAAEWGLELGPPFAMANVSYVAPAGDDAVLKVAWLGDEESLHEAEALALWGDAAVRVLRADPSRRAVLEERALPGSEPFRPVAGFVPGWLDETPSELTPLARELWETLEPGADWVVHGDFHHHNVLRHGDRFVAIDPKPYLADREYDVPSFLWNPMGNAFDNRAQTERRIAAFVAAGLDDFRIRAWTVIRGAYLRPVPEFAVQIQALL
jgi:streptomycin 6-kinase